MKPQLGQTGLIALAPHSVLYIEREQQSPLGLQMQPVYLLHVVASPHIWHLL